MFKSNKTPTNQLPELIECDSLTSRVSYYTMKTRSRKLAANPVDIVGYGAFLVA